MGQRTADACQLDSPLVGGRGLVVCALSLSLLLSRGCRSPPPLLLLCCALVSRASRSGLRIVGGGARGQRTAGGRQRGEAGGERDR